MREQQYYDQLIADNAVSQAEERRMLLAFVASMGAERSLCEYARTYVAEGKHAPLSRDWNLSAPPRERSYNGGGERYSGHPDSYPPNFQDR
jgi:hypothetical protein